MCWPLERRPATRMAARDCADRASSVANEKNVSCISLGNRLLASGYGIAVNPGAPKYIAVPVHEAVARAIDSRNHGYAP
jgi:hypothetical protein